MQVSVIVPLYNKGRSIERTVRSILAQTYQDFELLIIDDGSTDDGPEIIRTIVDPRIRLIQQSNAGPGAARNRGVAEALGDFVAFLDGDDEWLPNYLLASIERLRTCGTDVAATVSGYIEYPSQVSREQMWRRRGLCAEMLRITPETHYSKVIAILAYLSPCTTVMRRSLLMKLGGFLEDGCRYGEDAFLMIKLIFNYGVVVSMEPLVIYHKEDSALSANFKGPRPVEPFLIAPEAVLESCPAELNPLLQKVLSARALKTACVYGYWSQSSVARPLLFRFWRSAPLTSRYFAPALVSATPVGDIFGACLRACLLWTRRLFHP